VHAELELICGESTSPTLSGINVFKSNDLMVVLSASPSKCQLYYAAFCALKLNVNYPCISESRYGIWLMAADCLYLMCLTAWKSLRSGKITQTDSHMERVFL